MTYILALLCFSSFAVIVTLNSSPATHFEAHKLVGVDDSANDFVDIANVSPLARASILDRMLFSWSTPLITAVSSKDQIAPKDIPFLPATWRATTQMYRFSLRPEKRGLIAHLMYINRGVIILQSFLAATNSLLYYLPAYFLLQLVRLLEAEPNENSYSVGLFLCFGLLVSFIFEAVIAGQLWFYSSTSLACCIRMQLNSALFAKTLRVSLYCKLNKYRFLTSICSAKIFLARRHRMALSPLRLRPTLMRRKSRLL